MSDLASPADLVPLPLPGTETRPPVEDLLGKPSITTQPNPFNAPVEPEAPQTPSKNGTDVPAPAPSADELLGPPSADEVLGPPLDQGAAFKGPEVDGLFAVGRLDHLMTLFGQGAKDGWGTGELETTKEVDQALRAAGIFNDYEKGQHSIIRDFNEEIIRPGITALDRIVRAGSALLHGYQKSTAEGLPELGVPESLARDIAALPEAFPMGLHGMGELPRPLGLPELDAARDLRVIGKGEDGWKGPASAEPAEVPSAAARPPVEAQAPEKAPAAETRPPENRGDNVTSVSDRGEVGPPEVTPEVQSSQVATNEDIAQPEGVSAQLGPKPNQNETPETAAVPPSNLVDKAGNIRLDNLNQPDDVLQAIRDSADRNSGFLPERRGVMSDGEVLDLAEALGRDPAFLDRKAIGDAFNAEEVLAARKMLIDSATRVRDAMADVAAADPTDTAATVSLAAEIKRHQIAQDVIQGKLSQATAEWGRAGRSFRMLLDGQPEAQAVDAFLRDNSGYTHDELRSMAQLGRKMTSPEQVSKLIADTSGGGLRKAILYYYINSLISGPITHARYSVGNALNALWTPLVETPVAAGIGAARSAMGIGSAADRVYLGESLAQLYGMGKGTRDGFRAAVDAFRSNMSPALPGERIPSQFLDAAHQQPIPGPIGTVIGVPGRSVAAIHSFFKSLRYEQNIQALAYRQAMKEGLAGDGFAHRIAELTQTPTDDMMSAATAGALKELYMSPTEYNSLSGALVRATNHPSTGGFVLKVMAPFMKIGSQITRNAFIERTPLGLLSSEVRGNLGSGLAAGDLQAAKITAGVGLIAATTMMTLEGLITGDGPTDPAKRAVWLMSHRPNSLQIGNITVPYQGLGHLGMLMRFAANMTDTAQGWDEADGGKLATGVLESITRSVLDENFMRGVKDALDAVYHPEEYGPRWLKSFATNWLPFSVGMGQVARAIDPYSREQKSIFEAAQARMPLLSEQLQPRRDFFGEPIGSTTGLPQATGRYANDKTVAAMNDLQIGVGRLPDKVRGVKLNEQQYDDLSRVAGRYAKMRLDALTSLPAFTSLPAETRIKMINDVISSSRESARTMLMINNPALITAAINAKMKGVRGAR